jgi:hypothetical protein
MAWQVELEGIMTHEHTFLEEEKAQPHMDTIHRNQYMNLSIYWNLIINQNLMYG